MWEFITTTDHADDALMDEYEKHLCDPSVYLKVNWKQQLVFEIKNKFFFFF